VTSIKSNDRLDLIGRSVELALAEHFLAAASQPGAGPRALVLSGSSGIGKTILWDTALATVDASGTTIMRAAPAAAEGNLAYAGLTDLLRDVRRDVLDALPDPQRRALLVATLDEQSGGSVLDPRTVAAGLLGVVGASTVHYVVSGWSTQRMSGYFSSWANQELRDFTRRVSVFLYSFDLDEIAFVPQIVEVQAGA